MTQAWRERVEIAGGRAVLYLGDNREVWPALGVRPDAVVTDPPYGIAAAGATVTGGKRQWPLFRAGILGTVDQADTAFTQAMSAAADAVVIWGGNSSRCSLRAGGSYGTRSCGTGRRQKPNSHGRISISRYGYSTIRTANSRTKAKSTLPRSRSR